MVVNTNFIPEKTAALFEKFTVLPFIGRFTLVGGTALALQTGHRQSEDLDFIYDGEKIPTTSIKREISKHFQKYRLIREDKDYQLDFLIDEVRVTFFSTGAVMVPFSVKDYSEKYLNINIAGIEIIAVLKIGTLAQRNTIRDYYDLYFIAKYFITLSGIIEKSKILLPNISAITYTETIIYTDDLAENSIENHLKPKEILSKKQISEFFIAELKKIKNP
jgi:predicted nucleotidyltransferase component of viral defense system